jgi:hypothetical protein
MFVILVGRPDRMGATFTWYIMQIIYAHYHKWFIHDSSGILFGNSIFMQMISTFIHKYNKKLGDELGSHDHLWTEYFVENSEQDWPGNNMKVCKKIECDLVSYFNKHLYSEMREILDTLIVKKEYVFPNIDFKKTIGVHLRLDDVSTRHDYNGMLSSEYYRDKLNAGNIKINLEEERRYFERRGISIGGWGRHYNTQDCQAPIAENRIQEFITLAKVKYPDYNVVIVASPIGDVNLPYPTIRNTDADTDLAFLCNCDVVICSRSLYCFSSVYLGKATEIFLPMWGHIAGTGLMSKYDKNTHITYLS